METKIRLREQLARWMMEHGFATGHGDTFEDLLKELSWQVEELCERAATLREAQRNHIVVLSKDVPGGRIMRELAAIFNRCVFDQEDSLSLDEAVEEAKKVLKKHTQM